MQRLRALLPSQPRRVPAHIRCLYHQRRGFSKRTKENDSPYLMPSVQSVATRACGLVLLLLDPEAEAGLLVRFAKITSPPCRSRCCVCTDTPSLQPSEDFCCAGTISSSIRDTSLDALELQWGSLLIIRMALPGLITSPPSPLHTCPIVRLRTESTLPTSTSKTNHVKVGLPPPLNSMILTQDSTDMILRVLRNWPVDAPPPQCRQCDSDDQLLTFDICVPSNPNGNAGRPYIKCRRCSESHGFITFADKRGILPDNPKCYCDKPSRLQAAGLHVKGPPRGLHFVCAWCHCRYWCAAVDEEGEQVTAEPDEFLACLERLSNL